MYKKCSKINKGFTLIELLTVIAILGVISNIVLSELKKARSSAEFARSKLEFRSIATAINLYAEDNGGTMPPDVSRNLPPGLEEYLAGEDWPNAPWPGSVYDWENWIDPVTGERILQISIRFCTDVHVCRIPNEPWAAGFDYYSALYYCIEGSCRSHISKPINHPGYCVNC